MKKVLCSFCLLIICACVYEVPLVDESVIPIDPSLSGTWQLIPPAGEDEEPDGRMIILPFSATEYAVICSPGEKDQMAFRAYPVQVGDMQLIQLEWLQNDPENDARFHVCRYSIKDGILAVQMLNQKIVRPEITDSAALCETLMANGENPALFGERVSYRKLFE